MLTMNKRSKETRRERATKKTVFGFLDAEKTWPKYRGDSINVRLGRSANTLQFNNYKRFADWRVLTRKIIAVSDVRKRINSQVVGNGTRAVMFVAKKFHCNS